MTDTHGNIPHALATAHVELIAALDEGINQYKTNLRYSNAHDVCRCIERFVDALCQNPGGRDELLSRATLVETRSGQGSDYSTARGQSLLSYRGQPHKSTGSKLAICRLRKSNGTPLSLAVVSQERQDIERVLNEGILNLSDTARQAYESWRSACRAVQREAELLEVDGCWFLFHIHEAGEDNPTDRAKHAKAFTQKDMGGANLESIKAATESLVAWATDHVPNGSESKGKRKRAGRPKAAYETIQREADVAAEWNRKRENGIYKSDFAIEKGMTSKKLDQLLNRVYCRKRRSDK